MHRIDSSRRKSFKKLEAIWEKKLEDCGLANIEELNSKGHWQMKQSATNVFRGADQLTVRTRLEFFQECSSMCAQTKFSCEIERQIMEMYCDGIPQQEIKRALEQRKIKRHRVTISQIIRKYLILFGLHGK